MEFPDFSQFEPFLSLREKMGATRLGSFEFFDPKNFEIQKGILEEGFYIGLNEPHIKSHIIMENKIYQVPIWLELTRREVDKLKKTTIDTAPSSFRAETQPLQDPNALTSLTLFQHARAAGYPVFAFAFGKQGIA